MFPGNTIAFTITSRFSWCYIDLFTTYKYWYNYQKKRDVIVNAIGNMFYLIKTIRISSWWEVPMGGYGRLLLRPPLFLFSVLKNCRVPFPKSIITLCFVRNSTPRTISARNPLVLPREPDIGPLFETYPLWRTICHDKGWFRSPKHSYDDIGSIRLFVL
jgi:hypothetical protein